MVKQETLEFAEQVWNDLLDDCDIPTDGARYPEFDRLVAAYAEPHRYYHNLEHIIAMLNALEEGAFRTKDPAALFFAAWYHDVVYDPRSGDNESRSAEFARGSLRALGVEQALIERVAELILLTKCHEAPQDDSEASLFLDLDLSILGAVPDQYEKYAQAIREEYRFVNDREFYQGRRKILTAFLSRPRIFRSPWFEHLEVGARANLTAEIAQIDMKLATRGANA